MYTITKELKKKAFRINIQNCNTRDIHLGNKASKRKCFNKICLFFRRLMRPFRNPGWEYAYVCYNLRTEEEDIFSK